MMISTTLAKLSRSRSRRLMAFVTFEPAAICQAGSYLFWSNKADDLGLGLAVKLFLVGAVSCDVTTLHFPAPEWHLAGQCQRQ